MVFIGSSSIRLWSTLADDMAPLPVIQHGFGGSKLNDIVHYADRLVNVYQPRAVVVFAGTNDIVPSASKAPEVLLASYQEFVRKIRSDQPSLPIFYIGITPSPLRWSVWPIAQAANQLIENWSDRDPNLHFIDTSGALMGNNARPNAENYVFDGLHLSASVVTGSGATSSERTSAMNSEAFLAADGSSPMSSKRTKCSLIPCR